MTTTKQYDYLNRLTSISSVPSAAAVVSFAYQYNSANQRTAVTGNDGSYWTYGYDPLGQVTNGFKSWADTTLVAGEQFQYGFDTIGNRTRTAAGGDSSGAGLRSANYHANLLNQYTNRDVPGAFDVLGLALATNTTVAVNGQSPYRKSEFFRQQLSVTNTSSAVWQSVTVTATNAGTTTGNVFIAQTPEHFTYDLDGNLTGDGHWNYTWDAENRLIGMTNIASAAPAQGLAFGYDWKWRRVQKQVWYNGSLTNNTTFLYDGWNLSAVLSSSLSVLRSFLWGLDLSESLQEAGGVGGLLELNDATNGTHFVAFDGNGNVESLVSVTSGTNSATYEYGPFGELIRTGGLMAKATPLRFSTKYLDDETELIYYGYRYYSASTGKWLSKDPKQERGGPDLYAPFHNDGLDIMDPLGLCDCKCGEVHLMYQPGGNRFQWGVYRYPRSPQDTLGNRIGVRWDYQGTAKGCTFSQDENLEWEVWESQSGPPYDWTYSTSFGYSRTYYPGTNSYTDSMGYEWQPLFFGAYGKQRVYLNINFKCVGSDGAARNKQITIDSEVIARYKYPPKVISEEDNSTTL